MLKFIAPVAAFLFWVWYGQSEYQRVWIEQSALIGWVGLVTWMVAGWMARRLSRRIPMLAAVYAVLVIGACALVWGLWPVEPETPTITLWDRYAESWELGVSGERLFLYDGMKLTARVGEPRRFTPSVQAPEDVSLTNVLFFVCVPLTFEVQESPAWTPQSSDGCAMYSTRISQINMADAVNSQESLFFLSNDPGEFLLPWAISSRELPNVDGGFVVVVTP